MRRRPFLHLAAATLTTAGCLGAAKAPAGSLSAGFDSTHPDSARMAASGGTGAGASGGQGADAGSLSVETVETSEYVVRLNDLGDDPSGRVTDYEGLSDRERRVGRAAIADGYETRDPAQWLVRFASATPYLARDGDHYRLRNTFPTYRITAEAVPASDARRVATYDEYERAVTHDGHVTSALLRVARRESVELTYVWPSLQRFLDTYDAVRYRGEVVSFSVAVADPGPPYRISGRRVPVSATVGGSVWNASEASPAARTLVRSAGQTPGSYGFDSAPPGLLDALESHEYVTLDGTVYATTVEKRGAVPVAVSARVRDGRLHLALRDESDHGVELATGPPRPFGVLRCGRRGGPDARHLLWTDAYAESDRVRTAGRTVRSVNDAALTATLSPGETVAETYAVGDLPDGEYVVADSVEVRTLAGASDAGPGGAGTGSTLRYRVVFSVQ